MSRIRHFFALLFSRKAPITQCWRLSGPHKTAEKAAEIAAFFICIAACLYLMSERANAVGHGADNKIAATIKQQEEIISGMSKILDACLSDSTGKPIMLDGQIYLCGIVHVGPAQ